MSAEITATLAIEINTLNSALESTLEQALHYAVQIGLKLNEAKAALLHGEFGEWLEVNCVIKERQAQNYMKLAKEKPDFLNTHRGADLSIKAALELFAAPEEVKAEVQEKLALGASVTQKEIIELKRLNAEMQAAQDEAFKGIEAEKQRVEEWRQQFLDKRGEGRLLVAELERVKAAKKETVYIDDSSKALEQYREETVRKIDVLTKDLAGTRQELLAEKQGAYRKIEEGVNQKLGDYEQKITDLQKQETSASGRIATLRSELNALENTIGERTEQREALKGFNKCLLDMKVYASAMLNDANLHEDDSDAWYKSFSDANQFTYSGLSHISGASENLPEAI